MFVRIRFVIGLWPVDLAADEPGEQGQGREDRPSPRLHLKEANLTFYPVS